MNGDTLLTCLYFVEASVNYIKIEKREFLRVSSEPSRTTPNVTFLACLSSEVKLLLLILKSYVQMSGIAQFPPVWLAIACKSVDRSVDDAKETNGFGIIASFGCVNTKTVVGRLCKLDVD